MLFTYISWMKSPLYLHGSNEVKSLMYCVPYKLWGVSLGLFLKIYIYVLSCKTMIKFHFLIMIKVDLINCLQTVHVLYVIKKNNYVYFSSHHSTCTFSTYNVHIQIMRYVIIQADILDSYSFLFRLFFGAAILVRNVREKTYGIPPVWSSSSLLLFSWSPPAKMFFTYTRWFLEICKCKIRN